MTNEFIREDRYIVFKISDVVEHLTTTEALHLGRLYEIQRVGRREAGKAKLECVVVEADWPEYEPTWKAIEARVTDAQPAPSQEDESVRKAWSRFSNELHRSPDAPYPGMSEAFEQHFSQSFIDREWRAEAATWAAAWKAAKRHGTQPAPSVPNNYLAGVKAVANMLQKKADDYANEHGYDDMGGLSFGSGMSGEVKMDYYTNLLELVDEVRSMLAAASEAKS